MHQVFGDFETFSEVDIKRRGASVYARHASTEPLCLAYKIDGGATKLWLPGEPFPDDLRVVEDPETELHAHNATFERLVWSLIMVARYGWPAIRERQWHCTAARCAAMALPRDLDGAGAALGLAVRKDPEGKKLIHKLCKPRKPTKADPSTRCRDAALLAKLYAYCVQDVEAEFAVHHATCDLHPRERVVWLLDQRINERGIRIDRATVAAAIACEKAHVKRLTAELAELTGGKVTTAKQVEAFIHWLADQGVNVGDLQKATVAKALESPRLTPAARRALEIRQELGGAATAKFKAMIERADADDRVRGAHLFCGAERTGRWAGRGVQIQNFPRAGFDKADIPAAVDAIRTGDPDVLRLLYGSVSGPLTKILRPVLVASPGCRLLVSDFSGIEARVLAWLAGEEKKLQVFRDYDAKIGPDVYKVNAAAVYDKPATEITKDERQTGKVCELGTGYQMGAAKLAATALNIGVVIDEAFAAEIVRKWRDAHPNIVKYWWNLNDAAMAAVVDGGEHRVRNVSFHVDGRFLFFTLPSGRRLAYCDPEVRDEPTQWGMKPQLSYMGINSYSKKWERLRTYGGKLAENVTQAVSRDFLADAIVRLELTGYPVYFHVHDEIVSERPHGAGSIREMEQVMCQLPAWGSGCPIAAEGFESERYRK
jgi:DNA polymerase bacteriophage-type